MVSNAFLLLNFTSSSLGDVFVFLPQTDQKMRKKYSFSLIWQSLKDAFSGFSDDKVTKLAASLAYYTGFALAPLFILIMSISSLFFGQEAVQGSMDNEIREFVGSEAARQIQDIIRSSALTGRSTMATIIGAITLVIGATTVFAELQDSMNSIWGLKPRPKVGIMKTIQTRVLSFGVIASLGFILLVSLAATTVVESVSDRLRSMLPDVTVVLFYIINLALTLVMATLLFGIIFKALPDAKIKWKDILPGAFATSLLFLLGKFGISLYIGNSDLGSTYGAAGSLAVIFVWIYYSSIILYFGAEFTKALALHRGATIVPNKYAEWSHEPAVPGAEPKEVPANKQAPLGSSPAPSERESRPKGAQPMPQMAVSNEQRVEYHVPPRGKEQNEKNGEGGIGNLLLGFAIYFMTRNKDEQRQP